MYECCSKTSLLLKKIEVFHSYTDIVVPYFIRKAKPLGELSSLLNSVNTKRSDVYKFYINIINTLKVLKPAITKYMCNQDHDLTINDSLDRYDVEAQIQYLIGSLSIRLNFRESTQLQLKSAKMLAILACSSAYEERIGENIQA